MTPHISETRAGKSARHRVTTLFGAALAVLLAGCGDGALTTAPQNQIEEGVTFVNVPADNPSPARGSLATTAYPNAQLSDIVTTKTISALLGGVVIAGRHTLVFAPLALSANTTITLVDKTNSIGIVQAECYPEGLKFKGPVTLTSRIPNPLGFTMFWWDPSYKQWKDIGGNKTPDNLGIAVILQHFSTYRPGTLVSKAGW